MYVHVSICVRTSIMRACVPVYTCVPLCVCRCVYTTKVPSNCSIKENLSPASFFTYSSIWRIKHPHFLAECMHY